MSPRGTEKNESMRAETLAKVSAASLKVFAAYGYHGATMRRIAQTAGLSYGLVYHYFPSKAKVFRHLVDFALDSTIAAMRAFLTGPGRAWEKIEAYAAILIQSALTGDSSLYFLIMLQAATQGKSVPGLQAYMGRRYEEYFKIFAPLIAEAQEEGLAGPGDPEAIAAAFFAFLQGLALFTFHKKGFEKNIGPDMLMAILKNGTRSAK